LALAEISLPPVREAASIAGPTASQSRVASDSIAAIAARDPFRISRRPVIPAYDPVRLAEQTAPLPPRPVLSLAGVVEGGDPSAVIEGIPGVEGPRVMRVGDSSGGLQVKQIRNGRVTIGGMDTTWVLEVREPWKN